MLVFCVPLGSFAGTPIRNFGDLFPFTSIPFAFILVVSTSIAAITRCPKHTQCDAVPETRRAFVLPESLPPPLASSTGSSGSLPRGAPPRLPTRNHEPQDIECTAPRRQVGVLVPLLVPVIAYQHQTYDRDHLPLPRDLDFVSALGRPPLTDVDRK